MIRHKEETETIASDNNCVHTFIVLEGTVFLHLGGTRENQINLLGVPPFILKSVRRRMNEAMNEWRRRKTVGKLPARGYCR